MQASPQTQTHSAVQQRCSLWTRLGCWCLGRGISLLPFLYYHLKAGLIFLFDLVGMQCPVTCGGGVRSRTVMCAISAKRTCDLSTKPRSRSLCALQSCPNSGLQRRPGHPPKYRRIYPPKNQATRHPLPSTRATWSSATSATPTAMMTTTEASTASTSKTTMSKIADNEFGDEFHSGKNDKLGKGFPSKADDSKDEREEEEEGSTPNMVGYTPGYDYVVEDRMTEEEGIIDLDVTTSAPFKIPLQSAPPTSFGSVTHTSHTQTDSTTMFGSKPPTTSSSSHSTAKTWAETTQHHPVTTRPSNPYSRWTGRIPLATTSVFHTTQPPSATARGPFTTALSPRSTKKIIKVKKPAVTRKKNSLTPHPKNSTSSRTKSHSQEPNIPQASTTSDQTNPKPVSMDIFWVAGNWSEVGA